MSQVDCVDSVSSEELDSSELENNDDGNLTVKLVQASAWIRKVAERYASAGEARNTPAKCNKDLDNQKKTEARHHSTDEQANSCKTVKKRKVAEPELKAQAYCKTEEMTNSQDAELSNDTQEAEEQAAINCDEPCEPPANRSNEDMANCIELHMDPVNDSFDSAEFELDESALNTSKDAERKSPPAYGVDIEEVHDVQNFEMAKERTEKQTSQASSQLGTYPNPFNSKFHPHVDLRDLLNRRKLRQNEEDTDAEDIQVLPTPPKMVPTVNLSSSSDSELEDNDSRNSHSTGNSDRPRILFPCAEEKNRYRQGPDDAPASKRRALLPTPISPVTPGCTNESNPRQKMHPRGFVEQCNPKMPIPHPKLEGSHIAVDRPRHSSFSSRPGFNPNQQIRPWEAAAYQQYQPRGPAVNQHFRPRGPVVYQHFQPRGPAVNQHFQPRGPGVNQLYQPRGPAINQHFQPRGPAVNHHFQPRGPAANQHFQPRGPAVNQHFQPRGPVNLKPTWTSKPAVKQEQCQPFESAVNAQCMNSNQQVGPCRTATSATRPAVWASDEVLNQQVGPRLTATNTTRPPVWASDETLNQLMPRLSHLNGRQWAAVNPNQQTAVDKRGQGSASETIVNVNKEMPCRGSAASAVDLCCHNVNSCNPTSCPHTANVQPCQHTVDVKPYLHSCHHTVDVKPFLHSCHHSDNANQDMTCHSIMQQMWFGSHAGKNLHCSAQCCSAPNPWYQHDTMP